MQPIDTSRLDHWDDLLSGIRTVYGISFNGETWMVPFDWGNTGLIYRTDEISPDDVSRQILTDPSNRGRISLPDNALTAVLEGMWTNVLLNQSDFDCDAALKACLLVARRLFPRMAEPE